MNLYLLDGSSAFLFFTPLVIILVISILIESIVMKLLKFSRFGKSLADSVIVNIVSLLLGFLLVGVLADLKVGQIEIPLYFTFMGIYLVTLLIEGIVLKLLNKIRSWRKVFTVSAIMNLCSWVLLYIYLWFSNRP
jgi:hypothetical protein